jgi:hypothetical protein
MSLRTQLSAPGVQKHDAPILAERITSGGSMVYRNAGSWHTYVHSWRVRAASGEHNRVELLLSPVLYASLPRLGKSPVSIYRGQCPSDMQVQVYACTFHD